MHVICPAYTASRLCLIHFKLVDAYIPNVHFLNAKLIPVLWSQDIVYMDLNNPRELINYQSNNKISDFMLI